MQAIGLGAIGVLLALLFITFFALRASMISCLQSSDFELWKRLGAPKTFQFGFPRGQRTTDFDRMLSLESELSNLPSYLWKPARWYRRVRWLLVFFTIVGATFELVRILWT